MGVFCLSLLFVLCADLVHSLGPARRSIPAEYSPGNSSRHVKDEFFVHLHTNYTLESHFETIRMNLSATAEKFHHLHLLNVYSIRIDPDVIHNVIRRDSGVKLVEHNHLLDAPKPVEVGESKRECHFSRPMRRQAQQWSRWWGPRSWNIAHVALWGKRPTDPDYYGENVAGLVDGQKGVHIYIMDTGVKLDHVWFDKDRTVNFKAQINTTYCGNGETMDDLDGHGTHVASIADMISPTIVNVKVICKNNPTFTEEAFARAVNDIADEHLAYRAGSNTPPGWKGSVINMSLDSGKSDTVKQAVAVAINAGIAVITSSGNDGYTNGATGPCGFPSVQCVGASSRTYSSPEWSNWGPEVTIMAPGVVISAADAFKPSGGSTYKSGTSQAAAHVAGIAAIFIGFEGINNNVNLVNQRLQENAQPGLFGNVFPPFQDALMVNQGMMHPDKDARCPYNGIRCNDELLGVFDGQNLETTFPQPMPTSVPDDPSSVEPEPGATETTTIVTTLAVTPVPAATVS